MKKENTYDIILCGGGASSLLLLMSLLDDPFFHTHKILLIEKEKKTQNDRTWSFWEPSTTPSLSALAHQWDKALFQTASYHRSFSLAPFQYKTLRSQSFYAHCYDRIAATSQVELRYETVTSITQASDAAVVTTEKAAYTGHKVFTSLPTQVHLAQSRYPVLQQHFIGWFVETEEEVFDPEKVTFMDFDLPQKGNTRFMYVLPFSKTQALVEYTLFSAELLKDEEYEAAIKDYLLQLGVKEYKITEKEQGSIPMTAYPFWKHNSSNILHIGTSGGWTKASTGFTFKKSIRKIERLRPFLKTNQPLSSFEKKTRFDFYDMLFLDVLTKHNDKGGALFQKLFQKNPAHRILSFLDDQTHFGQELLIMRSFPVGPFLRALSKRILGL